MVAVLTWVYVGCLLPYGVMNVYELISGTCIHNEHGYGIMRRWFIVFRHHNSSMYIKWLLHAAAKFGCHTTSQKNVNSATSKVKKEVWASAFYLWVCMPRDSKFWHTRYKFCRELEWESPPGFRSRNGELKGSAASGSEGDKAKGSFVSILVALELCNQAGGRETSAGILKHRECFLNLTWVPSVVFPFVLLTCGRGTRNHAKHNLTKSPFQGDRPKLTFFSDSPYPKPHSHISWSPPVF